MSRMLCIAVAFFVFTIGLAAAVRNEQYLHLVEQGRAEYSRGSYISAEKLLLAALQSLDRGDLRERAQALSELGNVYTNEDELSKAEQAYGQSLKIYRQFRDGKQVATDLRHLGALYSLQGREHEALRALKEALDFAKVDGDSALQADVLNIVGAVYYRQRNNSKAAQSFSQALNITSGAIAVPDLRAQLLNNLGNVYQAQHKYAEAESLLKEALNQTENNSGPFHPDLTPTLLSLGHLYGETRRFSEAEHQYLRALSILDSRQSELEIRTAVTLHALGAMYAKAGRKEEAYAALERAAIIARRSVSQHTEMTKILEDYSASLSERGRSREAGELLAEVRRARTAASLVVARPHF